MKNLLTTFLISLFVLVAFAQQDNGFKQEYLDYKTNNKFVINTDKNKKITFTFERGAQNTFRFKLTRVVRGIEEIIQEQEIQTNGSENKIVIIKNPIADSSTYYLTVEYRYDHEWKISRLRKIHPLPNGMILNFVDNLEEDDEFDLQVTFVQE